jgi:hypothetical protein
MARPTLPASAAGIVYTNQLVPKVPWSVHIVIVDRDDPTLELHSTHAGGGAVGLTPLSVQAAQWDARLGTALAGVNGDFYQRSGPFAGDPRGLQIVNGEVLSAPNGSVAFWIDARGEPHISNVVSQLAILWPDGTRTPCGLNGERAADGIEVCTPALEASTQTRGGRELVLEPVVEGAGLPLRLGRFLDVRVREVRESGNTPIPTNALVLSLGPGRVRTLPSVTAGTVLRLALDSTPSLEGARTAIGGGPVLVRKGRRQRIVPPPGESYEFTSMLERHPRTAVGWNANHYFLVQVDGRQKDLSVGMTLEELGAFLVKLGCLEAMNLDGGGSATLWHAGEVRNRPCDGYERPIANALLVVRKGASTSDTTTASPAPGR